MSPQGPEEGTTAWRGQQAIEAVARRALDQLRQAEENLAVIAWDLTPPDRRHQITWVLTDEPKALIDGVLHPRALACTLDPDRDPAAGPPPPPGPGPQAPPIPPRPRPVA